MNRVPFGLCYTKTIIAKRVRFDLYYIKKKIAETVNKKKSINVYAYVMTSRGPSQPP